MENKVWNSIGNPGLKLVQELEGGTCGDGTRDADEACDDGGKDSFTGKKKGGRGCSADCKKIEDGYECNKSLENKDTCSPKCGDGKRLSGENCDDGNTSSE